MSLVWAGVVGFPAYIINQYGDVRYEETNMPVQYEMAYGEKWYKLRSPNNVYHLRSQISLLVDTFPGGSYGKTRSTDVKEKVGLATSELSPRQLKRARYGGPRGGAGGQLGRYQEETAGH